MVEKFFTPKEANECLPVVKKIVGEIITSACEARLIAVSAEISQEQEGRLMELVSHIKSLIAKLEEIGCYYKDWNFDIGLVDFPAIIHGQQALLCWRSDEPEVSWFHGYEEGYAGRRSVTKQLIFS